MSNKNSKRIKPATPEFRDQVFLIKQNSQMTFPTLRGLPAPDDMVLKPTEEGYLCIFLHRHVAVSRCAISIEGYTVNRGTVYIKGSIESWVATPELDNEGSTHTFPLDMHIESSRFATGTL